MLERLKKIKPYVPGKPIEEVQRALGLKEVYKLASNEIPFAPLHIRRAVLKELECINRYPESGCFYLRQTLSSQLGVAGEQIVFGNGSDELIVLALRAFVEKGDKVVVAYPTFLIYEIQAQVQGADVVRVPLKDFRYSLDAMAEAIDGRTKIVFIANPDNPTGSYRNHRDIAAFLEKIPEHVVVFFDEAYFEFAPKDFPRSLELLKKRPAMIVSRTFSKAYGLAGLRLGYCISSPEIAEALNTIREPFNIDRLAQVAGVAALKNKTFLKRTVAYIERQKQYFYKQLNALGLRFIPSATNFILIDFKEDTARVYDWLLRGGVIVREMKGWGFNTFFRVTVGTEKENKKCITLLRQYCRKDKGGTV